MRKKIMKYDILFKIFFFRVCDFCSMAQALALLVRLPLLEATCIESVWKESEFNDFCEGYSLLLGGSDS